MLTDDGGHHRPGESDSTHHRSVDRAFTAPSPQGEADCRRRIAELEAASVVDRELIDQLKAASLADRELIAQLQAASAQDRDSIDNLEIALTTSRRIGAAVGIVMVNEKLTEDGAFARLRAVSGSLNRKVRDVADDVVLSGLLEHPGRHT